MNLSLNRIVMCYLLAPKNKEKKKGKKKISPGVPQDALEATAANLQC